MSYNQTYNQNNPPPKIHPHKKLLIEFYYQLKDAKELYADAHARLTTGLKNFFMSNIYEDFRNYGTDQKAFIENKFSLDRGYYSVKGKIDLAYSKEDKTGIVDWKLGDSSGGDESLQLLSYAMWAIENKKLSSGNFEIYMAHLAENVAVPFPISDQSLMAAEARIAQDVETMIYLDKYGKAAVAEAFSKCDQLKICALCQYQTLCHGRVILSSD